MKNVVLNIGHGPRSDGGFDPGATAANGTTERAFNEKLARALKAHLPELIIVDRPAWGLGLFAELNRQVGPEGCVISLHANAASPYATGSEVLYWAGSSRGQRFAQVAQREIVSALGLPDRGLKAIADDPRLRGWALFRQTAATVILCEPFFLTNPSDMARANANHDKLVRAYLNILTQIENLCQAERKAA
jgi:N-acetylmuramoyl-L-alanine amidase